MLKPAVRVFDFDMQRYRHDMNVLIILALSGWQYAARLRENNQDLLQEANEKYHELQTARGWREYAEFLERIIENGDSD